MIATTSEMSDPAQIGASACRWMKEGDRIFIRCGDAPPSLTT